MSNLRNDTEKDFDDFKKNVEKIYMISNEARSRGLDPEDFVESPIALSMAEKVISLIATIYPQISSCGIDERILNLEKEYGKLNPTVVFKIAEEVAEQKFCKFNNLIDAMDAGIRIGFGYITLGVVSSPIEGYTGIKIGKRLDGGEYIIANFSGPIRSAGTTASCLVLIIIDFLREKFGFLKYDPTNEEIERVYAELYDFDSRVTNLQYMPTSQETLFIAKNLPIQIAGDPSEKLEVSNFKNLDRVDTNYLRSGVCLVLGEGLSQKAAKGFRLLNQARNNGISCSGFDWLNEYIKIHEKNILGKGAEDETPTYIKDLVAGRPVFSHPSRSGGFRFRYGRGRNSGFSSVCVHPATMAVTDNFIAIGSQLKLEKPTKGCTVSVCDSIEGPIVRLKNGSVRQLFDKNEAEKLYSDIDEIIYLGDILFPYSDVLNRNVNLIKPGYVEEWWREELAEKVISSQPSVISLDLAVEFSEKYGISLYPRFIFYWKEISKIQLREVVEFLRQPLNVNRKLSMERSLGLLGVCFKVVEERIVIDEKVMRALLLNLGDLDDFNFNGDDVLEIVNRNSKFSIRDKSGDFIGARMGRPEKAKVRKIQGSPNSLFPVGSEGGRLKTMQAAYSAGKVTSNFSLFYCDKCGTDTVFRKCEKCSGVCKQKYYFKDIGESFFELNNGNSRFVGTPYSYREIDFRKYFDGAVDNLFMREDVPEVVKSIRRTFSGESVIERIEKGILRAKYNLQVNKDGTIRFDATELALTQFKSKEIGTSVSRLRELGYLKDIYGEELITDEQILDLKPHDVLIPLGKSGAEQSGDVVFMNICNFVDELLEKFYGLSGIHKVKTRDDLIGQIGVCMAPHNCAGVACRFIGFSNTLGLMASPYMHAAIRRDCDGDEAAVMLLSDVLLNFSRKFLPSRRGGTQDAPLVMNVRIDAGEVDDQILDFECVNKYPLELYEAAEKREHSSKVKIKTVKDVLASGDDPFVGMGFTHGTSDFNLGVNCSSYKTLEDMKLKVAHQMELVKKIRAVDERDVARLIVETHFLKDIRGNLRKFSQQGFRCVECNEIMRRPPLSGKCNKCGGKLVFTVHEGGIKKYLKPAMDLAEEYDLDPYLKQTLELTKAAIDSIFGK